MFGDCFIIDIPMPGHRTANVEWIDSTESSWVKKPVTKVSLSLETQGRGRRALLEMSGDYRAEFPDSDGRKTTEVPLGTLRAVPVTPPGSARQTCARYETSHLSGGSGMRQSDLSQPRWRRGSECMCLGWNQWLPPHPVFPCLPRTLLKEESVTILLEKLNAVFRSSSPDTLVHICSSKNNYGLNLWFERQAKANWPPNVISSLLPIWERSFKLQNVLHISLHRVRELAEERGSWAFPGSATTAKKSPPSSTVMLVQSNWQSWSKC